MLGAEVLLRWAHPDHGSVRQTEFIPLAENTGLIVPLTLHVLDRALRQTGAWRAEGLEVGIAVNLSARTLVERDLPDRVDALCHRRGVPTSALVLEMTEWMVVADPARALPILSRLHELGVEMSVDDFGTGYSSMEYLKRLPVNEVKIDRSFVMTMATTPATRRSWAARSTSPAASACGSWRRASRPRICAPARRDGLRPRPGLLVLARAAAAEFAAWLTARELSALVLSA